MSPVVERTFAAGDVLMREGEASGDLWIIREGEVEVYRERRGRTFVLANLGPGEMLGTMTAATGDGRTASVRALTAGKASIISQEQVGAMIKGLPTWANAFIKDLVARVTYANDLYIESAMASAVPGTTEAPGTADVADSPLQAAWRCARTCVQHAEQASVRIGDEQYVAIDESLPLLAQGLDPAEAKSFIEMWVYEGLLTVVPGVGKTRHVPVHSVLELALFADVVGKALQEQEPGKPFTMPLAASERKLLTEMIGLGQRGARAGRVTIELAALEEALRKQGTDLGPEAISRAHRLGFLVFDKAAEPPTLSFDPDWLQYALRTLSVMFKIAGPKADASKKTKRTLLY